VRRPKQASSVASVGATLRDLAPAGYIAAVALFLLLLLTPAAGASKGVVGWIGGPVTGGTFPSGAGSGAGQFNTVRGIAVNTTGAGGVAPGTIYAVDGGRRVVVHEPDGDFVAQWGINVIGQDERQTVTINAAGGTYTLTLGANTTAPIPYDANNATVTTALQNLPGVGAGQITVSGFPADQFDVARRPYLGIVNFVGNLQGTDVPQMTANISGLTGPSTTGGPPTVETGTTLEGAGGTFAGYEVCTNTPATPCRGGSNPPAGTGIPNGSLTSPQGIAVNQSDGSVYVNDQTLLRVQKYTATGTPVYVIGRGVNESVAGAGFEICTLASGNTCATGTSGSLGGEFRTTFSGYVAVAPSTAPNAGNLLVADAGNFRVQEFTPAGGWVRAFGWDAVTAGQAGNIPNNEKQSVTIPATAGTFTLTFGANTTAAIPYNAPASGAGSVQSALNAIASVSTGGGSVSVTGGPGDLTGSTPYIVEFSGGPRADTDVAQMTANGSSLGVGPGKTLTCTTAITKGGYQWLRNGALIPGATSQTYVVTPADAGTPIQCLSTRLASGVGAGNQGGAVQASVPVVMAAPVPAGPYPAPPANLPNVTTTLLPGQSLAVGQDGGAKLNCTTGTWTGSPTSYSYQWYRAGVPLTTPGSATNQYTVTTADLLTAAQFQCAVTATNIYGSVTKISVGGGETTSGDGNAPDPLSTVADHVGISTTKTGASFEVCTVNTACKLGVAGSVAGGVALGQYAGTAPRSVAVDSAGVIYANDSTRVTKFTPQVGPPSLLPAIFGSDQPPPAGAPNSTVGNHGIMSVAIGDDDHLLALKEAAAGLTPACMNGLPSATERRIQELSNDGLTLFDTHGPCTRLTITSSSLGVATNPDSGDLYYGATGLTVNGSFQSNAGNRLYILNDTTAPTVSIDPPVPAATTAVVTGDGNATPDAGYPNPPAANLQVQYKLSAAAMWTNFRGPFTIGNGAGDVPFKVTLTKLLSNASYDVRVVATKEFDAAQSFSSPVTVTTLKAPPGIEAVSSSKVTASSAKLNATIDPEGTETSYYFEYGTTPQYGNKTPATSAGSGQGGQSVSADIEGLEDRTYHFRVVASSEAGESVSENQTFDFHPPSCPNAAVRQQTGSSYLPDCRAYEIASASLSGPAVIRPDLGPFAPYGGASSPSRFAYAGVFGAIPGTGDPINSGADVYVATRTSEGWVSRYIGLSPTETIQMGGPPTFSNGDFNGGSYLADESLSRILGWNSGNINITPNPYKSNAPYVFAANGSRLDRWPTNLGLIPDGEDFRGEVWASADLSHLVFSSDIPFTQDGVDGDIYANDTGAGTIERISKTEAGAAFSGSPIAISRDGSHILMTTAKTGVCPASGVCPELVPAPFVMSIDGVSVDVTGGFNARFAGMTKDGSKVYFTSTQLATLDDTDSNIDLFQWNEDQPDDLVRISGSGAGGNQQDCQALDSWTTGCNAVLVSPFSRMCQACFNGNDPIKPSFFSRFGRNYGKGGNSFTDSFLASESGDIFFHSPELLDGPSNGVEGGVNLYLFRDNEVSYVTTFDPGTVCTPQVPVCSEGPIARMEVSPDGSNAAFMTNARLTAYDNAGFTTMYRYRPAADDLTCVSCLPSGDPPTGPVKGSINGLYMTNDGRTFFATSDSLVSTDTNEGQDVYEYVDGRPQLITPGTGIASLPVCAQCGLTSYSQPGLVGVSADGTDAYFATFDVLTPQDRNGGNLKIYDARTNGGFSFVPPPPGCEAADECHGPSSAPPAPIDDGTGDRLGAGGNLTPALPTRTCKKGFVKRKGSSKKSGRCVKKAKRSKRKQVTSRKRG
jgi:hypothetical protein